MIQALFLLRMWMWLWLRRRVLAPASAATSWLAAESTPAMPSTRITRARANERAIALGIAIGAGYLFPTTFKNEVYSDLTGERGILIGALSGVMEAQYNVLRKHGHSPSEAFNETVEELTQSLIRLVGENGMDFMYANCSTTAQRGALDWHPRFRDAVAPVFDALYESVITATKPASLSKPTAAQIIANNLKRNLLFSMILKCGRQARRSVH